MASVLLFIESAGPGGAERVVHQLARGLRGRGHRVAVATLRTGWLTDSLAKDTIQHFQLTSTRRGDIGLPLRLSQLLRREGFQVLHSHLLDSNFYGALAARLARTPHVATEHGDVHHLQPKKFLQLKLRTISLCGSSMVAVSRFSAGKLLALGVNPRRVQVIGNPIDPVSNDAQARAIGRKELGLPTSAADHFVWIHVANLRPVKDQETLLRGFAGALRSSNASQTLLIVGDGERRAALEALTGELGIAPHVRFLGFSDDVHRWLQLADGFVLTSRSEALPMSLLEAAVHGLTPVVSAVGGLPEVVLEGETGLLFPAGDDQRLASQLNRAVADAAARGHWRDALSALIHRSFETPAVLAAYEALYGVGGS